MKILLLISAILGTVYSCGSGNTTSPKKDLIGKWDNAYEVKTKDESGKWTEWTTINTLVALPQLEFTSDGKVLWDGKPSEFCCNYLNYELFNDSIKFNTSAGIPEECALVFCAGCDAWTIEKLTDTALEVNICDNSMIKYRRGK